MSIERINLYRINLYQAFVKEEKSHWGLSPSLTAISSDESNTKDLLILEPLCARTLMRLASHRGSAVAVSYI